MTRFEITYKDINGLLVETVVRAESKEKALAYFNTRTPFIAESIKDIGKDIEDPQTPVIGPK